MASTNPPADKKPAPSPPPPAKKVLPPVVVPPGGSYVGKGSGGGEGGTTVGAGGNIISAGRGSTVGSSGGGVSGYHSGYEEEGYVNTPVNNVPTESKVDAVKAQVTQNEMIQREQMRIAAQKVGTVERIGVNPTTGERTYYGAHANESYTYPSGAFSYSGRDKFGGITTREQPYNPSQLSTFEQRRQELAIQFGQSVFQYLGSRVQANKETPQYSRMSPFELQANYPYGMANQRTSIENLNQLQQLNNFNVSDELAAQFRAMQLHKPYTQTAPKVSPFSYNLPREYQRAGTLEAARPFYGKQLTSKDFPKTPAALQYAQQVAPIPMGFAKGATNFLLSPVKAIPAAFKAGVKSQSLGEALYTPFFNRDVQNAGLMVATATIPGNLGKLAYGIGGFFQVKSFGENPTPQGAGEVAAYFAFPKLSQYTSKAYRATKTNLELALFSDFQGYKVPGTPFISRPEYMPEYVVKPIRTESGNVVGYDFRIKEGQQRFGDVFSAPKIRTSYTESGIPIEIGRPTARTLPPETQTGFIKLTEFGRQVNILTGTPNEILKSKVEALPKLPQFKASPTRETSLLDFGFRKPIIERIRQSRAFRQISKPLPQPKDIIEEITRRSGNQENVFISKKLRVEPVKVEVKKPKEASQLFSELFYPKKTKFILLDEIEFLGRQLPSRKTNLFIATLPTIKSNVISKAAISAYQTPIITPTSITAQSLFPIPIVSTYPKASQEQKPAQQQAQMPFANLITSPAIGGGFRPRPPIDKLKEYYYPFLNSPKQYNAKKKKKSIINARSYYLPSFIALDKRIYGKTKGVLTGLEIRGIQPIKRNRKRNVFL